MRSIKIELFYTLSCPNCKILKALLHDVLPGFSDKFYLKKSLASSPVGMIRTIKLGIHSVPTLMINNEIVFRGVPSKQEIIDKLKMY